MKQTKILLNESEMPREWYNVQADMKIPLAPPLHPATLQPMKPEEMAALFPMALLEQEMTNKPWISIPDEVLDVYALFRPSPLYRAHRLEKALGTPAKIYYKYEGVSPSGSHKTNTAIPQAYYNMKEGIKRIATETGAGQWGSAMSYACSLYGIDLNVYMVKVSYEQKPYRRLLMETYGAHVFPSPSTRTESGRKILADDPNSTGSLGMAISEAVEEALLNPEVHYALGSVLNHVLLHQTIIGLEAKKQLEKVGDYPDVVLGCVGGGSNFGGIALPFVSDKLSGKNIRLVGVEPAACPTITKGVYDYDYGDTAKMAPVVKMYTLGHDFVPPGIHAGGLRYHGMSPIISSLVHEGVMSAVAYKQNPVFDAAVLFANTEGILPAPESAHAIKGAIEEAMQAKEEGKEKTILFCLSGHGNFDLSSYDQYHQGKLEDFEYPEAAVRASLKKLPIT